MTRTGKQTVGEPAPSSRSARARPVRKAGRIGNRRRQFAEEYLLDGNGTRAAIRAGYSAKTAGAQASRLLKDAEVRQIIDTQTQAVTAEVEKRYAVTRDRVVRELAIIAFANFADYTESTPEGSITVDLSRATYEQLAALSEISVETTVRSGKNAGATQRMKIRLFNKHKALMDLARLQGYFNKPLDSEASDEKASEAFRAFAEKLLDIKRSALPIAPCRPRN